MPNKSVRTIAKWAIVTLSSVTVLGCVDDTSQDEVSSERLVETRSEVSRQVSTSQSRLAALLVDEKDGLLDHVWRGDDVGPELPPPLEAGCGVLGSGTYCSASCVCDAGEGDCDSNAECAEGTVCTPNVGGNYGFDPTVDVCEAAIGCHTTPPGDAAFCSPGCPCEDGQGDCDSDADCTGGTICVPNVGANYGWDPSVDVCETPSGCHTTVNGHPNHCSPGCPCDAGEGDCDSDADCSTGNVCSENVGATYGFDPSVDVCEAAIGCHTSSPGAPDFCSPGCPCEAGQGDCDTDADCVMGTVCNADVGANYGWHSSVDVCEAATGCHTTSPGDPDYCSAGCPCSQYEGDCDGSAQCGANLYCANDVGSLFGLHPTIDVCCSDAGPTAGAGGPYTTRDNSMSEAFSGTGTAGDATCGESVVEYAWDTDGDGLFGADDTNGTSVCGGLFSDLVGASPNCANTAWTESTLPVALRVSDNRGRTSASATTTLTVCSTAAPTSDAGGPYAAAASDMGVSLDGSNSSVASVLCPDTITAYDWDTDGDGLYGADDTDGTALCGNAGSDLVGATPTCANTGSWSAGSNTLLLRVTDSLGGRATASATLTINP